MSMTATRDVATSRREGGRDGGEEGIWGRSRGGIVAHDRRGGREGSYVRGAGEKAVAYSSQGLGEIGRVRRGLFSYAGPR